MITSTWRPLDADIQEFVAAFERRGADPESDSGEQFADQFVTADPHRTVVVSREMLVASLPQRRRMFEQAGVGAARHVRSAQLDLDERHLLVTTEWDAPRTAGEPLRLESTFLVRREADGPQILVYLNHKDVAAALSQRSA